MSACHRGRRCTAATLSTRYTYTTWLRAACCGRAAGPPSQHTRMPPHGWMHACTSRCPCLPPLPPPACTACAPCPGCTSCRPCGSSARGTERSRCGTAGGQAGRAVQQRVSMHTHHTYIRTTKGRKKTIYMLMPQVDCALEAKVKVQGQGQGAPCRHHVRDHSAACPWSHTYIHAAQRQSSQPLCLVHSAARRLRVHDMTCYECGALIHAALRPATPRTCSG